MARTIGTRLRRLLILGAAMILTVAFADVAHAGDLLGAPPAPTVTAATQSVTQTATPVQTSTPATSTPAAPTPAAPTPAAPTPAAPTPAAVTPAAVTPAAPVSTPGSKPPPAPAAPTPAAITTAATDVTRSATTTVTKSASDLAARATSTASSAANDVTASARPLVQAAAQTVDSTAAPIVRSTVAPVVRLASDATPTVTNLPDAIRPASLGAAHTPSGAASSASVPSASKADAVVTTTLGRTAAQGAAPQRTPAPGHFRFVPPTEAFTGAALMASPRGSQSREHSPPGLPERLPPLPRPDSGVLKGLAGAGGGGLLLFGLLVLAFLLAIPNAVRWLRPAPALGLSPAYVAPGDRPG